MCSSKLKDITKADAQLIYKLDFYDQYRLEEINNPIIAKTMFHLFVNGRPNEMALLIQQGINKLGKKIDIDGTLGSMTIKAINKLDTEGKSQELNKKLIELRLELENKLKDHKKFHGRRKRFERLLKE